MCVMRNQIASESEPKRPQKMETAMTTIGQIQRAEIESGVWHFVVRMNFNLLWKIDAQVVSVDQTILSCVSKLKRRSEWCSTPRAAIENIGFDWGDLSEKMGNVFFSSAEKVYCGDGAIAEFEGPAEADEAAEMLRSEAKDRSDYLWTI